MARKRMIDPSLGRDEKVGQCSCMERLLFIGLWTFADDSGVGRASPLLIKADVFPYDTTLREADIEKGLAKLASLKLIVLYEVEGQKYYHVTNFAKHQSINRPSPSTLPAPPPPSDSDELTEHSVSDTGALPPNLKEEKRKEDTRRNSPSGVCDFFETIWQLYPKKKGKSSISDKQKRKLYDIGL